MVEIDLDNAPVSKNLYGVHLWYVTTCYPEKAKSSGEQMLVLKMHSDGVELVSRIMLTGNGARLGFQQLRAFGLTGKFDHTQLIGRRVWVATKQSEYNGQERMEVDISQLACKGYQAEDAAPVGSLNPTDGLGNVPF